MLPRRQFALAKTAFPIAFESTSSALRASLDIDEYPHTEG
jgi:hypothetical protein